MVVSVDTWRFVVKITGNGVATIVIDSVFVNATAEDSEVFVEYTLVWGSDVTVYVEYTLVGGFDVKVSIECTVVGVTDVTVVSVEYMPTGVS